MVSTVPAPHRQRRSPWQHPGWIALLIIALALAVGFVVIAARMPLAAG